MKIKTFTMYGFVFFNKRYLTPKYSILGKVLHNIGTFSSLNKNSYLENVKIRGIC